MNSLVDLPDQDKSLSLALGINRDLFPEEDNVISAGSLQEKNMTLPFYRSLKNSRFDYIFEVSRNVSGYSLDVHGQLNVIMNHLNLGQQMMKNVKFKLSENKVEIFEYFKLV
mmetsp:Transcript_36097/g.35073  ORF Transcript_36097/g.35073 Transcript_36097/m.35073 type:complete len:112 (+) Transcript_36097:348-683(+)